MSTNPLRQPPFFPVANVNPDDPISVQIEQIEQLNTLLLQDIDHNFARFHDVVNNKILPQVKRYGIVSEPTRAASEFWKTFFYSAAFGQTALEPRHPDDADTSHAHGGPGYRHEEYEQTLTLDHTGMGDRTGEEDRGNEEDLSGLMTPDEHSFLYGNPIASTPLPKHHLQHLEGHHEQPPYGQGQGQGNAPGRGAHAHMNQPWAEGMSSMESPTPYASLERKMKEVLEDDDGMSSTAGSFLPEEIGLDTPKPGGSASGSRSGGYEPYQTPEGLDEEPSVLISRSDQSSSYHHPGEPSSAHKASANRDLPDLPRFKSKLPSHLQSPRAHMNPFSPVKPGNKSGSATWDGIADLRNTPLNPKIRPLSFNQNGNGNGNGNGATRNQAKNDRTPRRAPTVQQGGGDDSFASDSDEEPQFGLAAGGTPPVTMNFGLPDRTIVSKTPAKEAAKAVIRNLMMDDEGMDSPGMPTPPAFSRFAGGSGAGSTSMSMSSSVGKGSSMSPSKSAGGRGKGGLFSHELDQRGDETIRDTMGRMELDDSPLMGMTEPLPPTSNLYQGQDQGQDPDVSTVGMPKHRRSTVPQLDFLDESFDDSLDEMPPPALPQGYVTESYGDPHQGQHRQHGRDVGQDSLAGEMEEEEGAVGEFTMTEQQQPRGGGQDGTTRSEAGEVFGGAGRTGLGSGGFALFGPDEMQTFHGGQLLDAAASPQDSPSYALGAKMAHKRG